MCGGGQAGGLRSGTENVPYIHAFAKSLDVIGGREEGAMGFEALQEHHRAVCGAILSGLGDLKYGVNVGSDRAGASNVLSLSFEPVPSKVLVAALQERHGVTIAAGSACDAGGGGKPVASRTMKNLPGVSEGARLATVRISCGFWNTVEDGKRAGEAIRLEVRRLREEMNICRQANV